MADKYRHLIGGEVNGKRHEPGDPVDGRTAPRKLNEWLKAGVIERANDKEKRTHDDDS